MDLTVGWVPGHRDLREVGAGASGRVVMAVDEDGSSLVAVKYLAEGLVGDARFREEFRKEIARLSKLESGHIVRVRDYVEGDDGAAIVMDLVDGVSLRELLDARGPLEPEAALAVWKGSLLGLSYAHEVGVVHRDHRPENVLITPEGVTTLVDFGVVPRSYDRAENGGVPTYLPPERWRYGLVLPVGDVYASAVVFYECLTGQPPYQANSVSELEELHSQSPIPVEDVPEALHGLLRQGLAKDRRERTAKGSKLAEELHAVADTVYGDGWERRGMRLLAIAVAEHAVLALSEAPEGEAPGDTGSRVEKRPKKVEKTTAAPAPAPEPVTVPVTSLPAPVDDRPPERSKRKPLALPPLTGKVGRALLAGVSLVLFVWLVVFLTRSPGIPDNPSTTVRPSTSDQANEPVAGTIPNVTGIPHSDATKKLREAGLVPYVLFKQSQKHEPGTVIETDPAEGTDVGRGALVGLVVAQRTPVYAVTVPDVRGHSYTEARSIIRTLELTPLRMDQESPSEPGTVLSTAPDIGTNVERGSQVTVYVAKPAANTDVPVPNVTRFPQDRAEQTVRDAGLNPVVVVQRNGSVPRGQVISSDPGPGVRIASGASVTLYVSRPPATPDTTVPQVAGSSYEAAAQRLRDAGLTPEHATTVTSSAAEGTVLSTDPAAGSSVKPGSKVTVRVAQAPPLSLSATASVNPPSAVQMWCRRGYPFTFSGSVSVSRGPLAVTYRWTRSDGTSTQTRTLNFPGTGPQTLPVEQSTWTMDGRDRDGWARLQVLSPGSITSNTASFTYDCRRGYR